MAKIATKTSTPDTDAGNGNGTLTLPALNIRMIEITLVGDTPLITHAWSEKAKKMMFDKQTKAATQAKAAKDPLQDFIDAQYRLPDGGYGFPSVGLKNAAVTACTSIGGITKVAARQAFHVFGEPTLTKSVFNGALMRNDMVRIHGSEPVCREDMVRVGQGTADLRYRPEFFPWFVKATIRYNANVLSAEQIANLFNTAGFSVGVCEWRPEKDGSFGMFHLATQAELDAINEGRFAELFYATQMAA